MGLSKRIGMTAAYLLASSAAWAAEPVPEIAPAPNWAIPVSTPTPDPAKAGAPFQLLVISSQERLLPDGMENYVEVIATPQTTAGLSALGNVTIPWNAGRADLVLHKVAIRRGDATFNLLKPDEILVLRRENNLERSVLDGVRTVVIPARGLETGDILTYSATYRSRKSSVGNVPEEIQPLASAVPINRADFRVLVPDNVTVRWKYGSANKAQILKQSGVTEHKISIPNLGPLTLPKNTPDRFKEPVLQFTAYNAWSEIAEELAGPFAKARLSAPGSPLMAEAAKIAALTADPGERALAALRLAQERVRYVALLLGEGAYVPATADETWERRFGDCKGKTALLLALLDKLGIQAEPVLVSNGFNDRLSEHLPSLAMFDHVIVRVRIGGRSLYLDATDFGQRTLADVEATDFLHGLPLRKQAELEVLASPPLSGPTRDAKLTWNAAQGIDGEIPYEASLTLRGAPAALYRAKLSAATDPQEVQGELKNMMPGVANDDLTLTSTTTDAPDGSFIVRFSGKAKMDWSPFEGERTPRFSFNHSAVHWDYEFDRKDGPGKDLPVALGNGRYWERLTETVILPQGGKGFQIDGKAIDRQVAGSRMMRRLQMQGNEVTMESEFQHLEREISAGQARAAEPVLDEHNEDWAYIVRAKEEKPSR